MAFIRNGVFFDGRRFDHVSVAARGADHASHCSERFQMIQVVWFKKDLRVSVHQPLWEACKRGPVLPLYVFEPEIMLAGDYSMQHYGFTRESLLSLEKQLRDIGLRIAIRHAPILQVFASLMSEFKGFSLLSHEETGNALSFQRDLAVGSWCRSNGIVWEEFASKSVVRRLKSRDRWASLWNQRMSMIPLNIPKEIQTISLTPNVQEWPDQLASVTFLQLSRQAEDKGHRQVGGLAVARGYLHSFLKGRGVHYRSAMSAPMTAQEACSRLSPYLTMGVLSVRQVVHELKAAQDYWRGLGPDHTPQGLLSSLSSFESRLHWHCHFIQKLESEPRLEFENLHPAYDGMRDSGTNGVRLKAWS